MFPIAGFAVSHLEYEQSWRLDELTNGVGILVDKDDNNTVHTQGISGFNANYSYIDSLSRFSSTGGFMDSISPPSGLPSLSYHRPVLYEPSGNHVFLSTSCSTCTDKMINRRDSAGTQLSINSVPSVCGEIIAMDNAGDVITEGSSICRFVNGVYSNQFTINNLHTQYSIRGVDSSNNLIVLLDDNATPGPEWLAKYNMSTGFELWKVPIDLSSMYNSTANLFVRGPDGVIVDNNDNIIIYGKKASGISSNMGFDWGYFHAIKYDSNGQNPIHYNTPNDYSSTGYTWFTQSFAYMWGFGANGLIDRNVDVDSSGNLYFYGTLDKACNYHSTFGRVPCDDLLQIYSPQGDLVCAHSEDINVTRFDALSVEVGSGGEIYLGAVDSSGTIFYLVDNVKNTYLTKYTPTLPDIDIGLRLFDGAATVPIAVKSAPKGCSTFDSAAGATCGVNVDGTLSCWNNVDGGAPGADSGYSYSGTDAVSVAVGTLRTCVLFGDGNVDCNAYGSNPIYEVFTSYTDGDAVAVSVAAGATCILKEDGNVNCGGRYLLGGPGFDSSVIDHTGNDAKMIGMSTFGVACALLEDKNVTCWGDTNNPLSDGYAGGDADAVFVGPGHACVLTEGGDVHCWGGNNTSLSEVELLEYTQGDAIDVAVGFGFTCALLESGNAICTGGSELPNDYTDGGAVAMSAGDWATQTACILLANGDVRCWDRNIGDWGYTYTATDVARPQCPHQVEPIPTPLRLSRDGTAYSVSLVSKTSPDASKWVVQTPSSGAQSLKKFGGPGFCNVQL